MNPTLDQLLYFPSRDFRNLLGSKFLSCHPMRIAMFQFDHYFLWLIQCRDYIWVFQFYTYILTFCPFFEMTYEPRNQSGTFCWSAESHFYLDIRNFICGSFHKLHFGHFISALIFFGIVQRGPVAGCVTGSLLQYWPVHFVTYACKGLIEFRNARSWHSSVCLTLKK